MEIRILSQDSTGQNKTEPFLAISHRGVDLKWRIPSKELDFPFDIFEQINGYWAQCHPKTQDEIFEIYAKIYDVFQTIWDINVRVAALRPLVADLMDFHPQEDIFMWAWSRANIVVPASIHRTFDKNGTMAGTLERTYLDEDYRQLVALSISLRVMFPIWRQFTADTRRESGNIFKEYQAYQLLALSEVAQCKAMNRLMVFIRHTIPKDRHNDAAILVGISSEDIPNWVLSVTVVTRLCCGDVRGINQNPDANTQITTLPAYLYNFILQKLRGIETSVGNVSPKNSGTYAGDGDSNLSKLEGFKIKQPTSIGNIETISAYLEIQMDRVLSGEPLGPRSLTSRLSTSPDFPRMVVEAYQSVQELDAVRLTREQVAIAGWVLKQFIPVRSIPSLQKQDLLKMIAFAVAYLWEKNHFYLAAFASGIAIDTNDDNVGMIADRKDAIDKEELVSLMRRYIFTKRTGSRAKTAKSINPVITAIETMTQSLSKYQWRITLPEHWISKAGWNPRSKVIKIPTDIRTRLALVLIDVDDMKPLPRIPEHYHSAVGQMPETPPATNWAAI